MSSITVTQLKYFEAVARYGGFSKAAEAINVSQPALTRQIRALEDECRTSLLRRTSRGVFLTEAGETILEAARQVFESLNYVENLAASLVRSTLRIRSVATPRLAEFIRLCRENLKDIEIDVSIATYDEILNAIERRDCDIGFLTMPADRTGFEAIEIGRYSFSAYVSPEHRLAGRSSISIKELSGERLVISPKIRRSRQVFDQYLEEYGVEIVLGEEVGSVETIWFLARENIGVGIMSDNGHMMLDGLSRLTFQEPLSIPLHMVALHRNERTKLAHVAFALGRRVFVTHPRHAAE